MIDGLRQSLRPVAAVAAAAHERASGQPELGRLKLDDNGERRPNDTNQLGPIGLAH